MGQRDVRCDEREDDGANSRSWASDRRWRAVLGEDEWTIHKLWYRAGCLEDMRSVGEG